MKVILRLGNGEVLESFREQALPLEMWQPEPIDAMEADLARASLQVCHKALLPAEVGGLLEAVTRLLLPYGFLPKSGSDKQVLLDQWQRHLRMFPLWAVQQVCHDWQRHNGIPPSIFSIVAGVEGKVAPINAKVRRLERLIKTAEAEWFYRLVIEGARMDWEEVDAEGCPRPRVLPANNPHAAG